MAIVIPEDILTASGLNEHELWVEIAVALYA